MHCMHVIHLFIVRLFQMENQTGADWKYILRRTFMQNNVCINILHRIHLSDHDQIARDQPVSRMPSLLTDVI